MSVTIYDIIATSDPFNGPMVHPVEDPELFALDFTKATYRREGFTVSRELLEVRDVTIEGFMIRRNDWPLALIVTSAEAALLPAPDPARVHGHGTLFVTYAAKAVEEAGDNLRLLLGRDQS